ncbi:MAG: hypothetical protein QOH41_1781 [Blastocatellia bacterium]|nr:hypothetical protein [Blastocatellia bacterium]
MCRPIGPPTLLDGVLITPLRAWLLHDGPSGLNAGSTQNAFATSHPLVIGPAAAFRCYPINNLVRIHDVAGLAMDAV